MYRKSIASLSVLLFIMLAVVAGIAAETFMVTSSENSGPGTLREAIAASNTRTGIQTIAFAITNSITVYTPLSITAPIIVDGSGITVGSRGNDVLQLNSGSSGSSLTGMAIVSGNYGIYIASNSNYLQGCAIGTDWNGSSGRGNTDGIYISSIGTGNLIGGDHNLGQGNIISGNSNYGITNQCNKYFT